MCRPGSEAELESLAFAPAIVQGTPRPAGKPGLPCWDTVFIMSAWTNPAMSVLRGCSLMGKQKKINSCQFYCMAHSLRLQPGGILCTSLYLTFLFASVGVVMLSQDKKVIHLLCLV